MTIKMTIQNRVWRVPLLALLMAVACTGCQTADSFKDVEKEPGQRSDGFPAADRGEVWDTAVSVLRTQGYRPDLSASSQGEGVVRSEWLYSLAPFSRSGWRERAIVRIVPVDGRSGYYRLQTTVTRQNNDNIKNPSDRESAEWAQAKRNPNSENLINRRIEMEFLAGEVSNKYRKRHGMKTKRSKRMSDTEEDDELYDERNRDP